MNRRPTDQQLGEMLKTPHFGNGASLPPSDPVVATPMVITLDQIKPYDRNPRRERNPLYDEIKESIQAKGGLNNPFNITRRPGEQRYMVESGGNTRLQILNELFQETQDERYFRLHVLYQPWISETHVLTAHLIENEKRGEMLFIDKALAIRELKQIYEQEQNNTLSLRKLLEQLKQDGYAVNLNLLSRIDYAVDVLLPAIPEALRAGMGRPTIERIRQLQSAFSSYWCDIAGEESDDFDAVFADALEENNRAEWDSDALRHSLEQRFISFLEVPLRNLKLEIDALLFNKRKPNATSPEAALSSSNLPSLHPDDEVTSSSDSPASKSPGPITAPTATPAKVSAEAQAADTEGAVPPSTSQNPAPSSLHQLRQTCYHNAHNLAEPYMLEGCLIQSLEWGLGFLVESPQQPLSFDRNRSGSAKQQWETMIRQWVWWLLYLCSEQSAQPERIALLPEEMVIRQHLMQGNHNTFKQALGMPVWQSLSYQLLADPLFPKQHFERLIQLIISCREIREHVGTEGDDQLWLERDHDLS